jgi:hypothetical protein
MNMGRKKIFVVLMVTIGCLIFNFNLKLSGESGGDDPSPSESESESYMFSLFAEAIEPAVDAIVYSTIGSELAALQVAADNSLTNAFSNRITSVKGCSAGPFVHAIYGRVHRNDIVSKCSYKNDVYGFVLGVDNVWTFDDEKYFCLGTVLGYVQGRTTPSGSLSRTGETSNTTFNINSRQFIAGNDHDIYAVKLFGTYESFDDKCLKTNIGVILGYNLSRDKLYVGDFAIYTLKIFNEIPDIKFVSNSIFLGVEFIKNLYAYNGYQFGLWLKANYSHTFPV